MSSLQSEALTESHQPLFDELPAVRNRPYVALRTSSPVLKPAAVLPSRPHIRDIDGERSNYYRLLSQDRAHNDSEQD